MGRESWHQKAFQPTILYCQSQVSNNKLSYRVYYLVVVIIESVDSICRDSTDMQYMIIQEKTLEISKTANL